VNAAFVFSFDFLYMDAK